MTEQSKTVFSRNNQERMTKMKTIPKPVVKLFFGSFFALIILIAGTPSWAFNFPAAGWHRGDVSVAQENSRAAISKALNSANPNFETDITDFIDQNGKRVGLVSHDYLMKRATGEDGAFSKKYNDLTKLPQNKANAEMQAEPFMTVIELFDLIKERKAQGVTPTVSLDMKDEGKSAEEFSQWVGKLIQQYGFQQHVFASSFFTSNSSGVKAACPECMVGGLVFNDHFALKHLDYEHTSLDLTILSKITYLFGFWGKKEFNHDFVLIQDDIFFAHPELVDYWKDVRKAKFVGVYVYNKSRGYTEKEWDLLKKVDWLELDPPQMNQYLQMNKKM
jgi:glycerophosphoryl diester phosphodiesterase